MYLPTANSTNRLIITNSGYFASLLTVRAIAGVDKLSTPFSYDITTETNDWLDIDDYIGSELSLTITSHNGNRHIHGLISNVTKTQISSYTFTLRPWFWFLTLTKNSRAYENKTAIDIIKDILTYHNFNHIDYSKLTKKLSPYELCIQYNESDFDFINRILADNGIFYCFEHSETQHTMVLYDTAFNNKYEPELSRADINKNNQQFKLGLNSVTAIDSNPFALDKPIKISAENKHHNPKLSATLSEHHHLTINAKQKINAQDFTNHNTIIDCDRPSMTPGIRTILDDKPLLVLEQRMDIVEPGGNQSNDAKRHIQITLSPLTNDYTPPLIPWPKIPSIQIAIVTGRESANYLDIDQHARIKVQFHWDRYNEYNEHSSCWLRVAQQQASNDAGTFFTPYIGEDVIVSFLDGHPNRPVILGTVNNSILKPAFDNQKTPYLYGYKRFSCPDGQVKYQEFSFNDQPNNEQITIQTSRDYNNIVQGDSQLAITQSQTNQVLTGNLTAQSLGDTLVAADQGITYQVGRSQLVIDPTGIHLDADKVQITTGTTGALPLPDANSSWLSHTWALLGYLLAFVAFIPLDEFGAGEAGQAEIVADIISTTKIADPGTIEGRMAVARQFYLDAGYQPEKIGYELNGIDFSKPLSVEEIQPESVMSQYQIEGRRLGRYFSDGTHSPSELGINPRGLNIDTGEIEDKISKFYKFKQPALSLKSTSAPIEDTWSVMDESFATEGGGTQYFIPDNTNIDEVLK